ncbi:hypothetical protein ANCDUO_03996 [Ancylostoma duodenale]|uniref:Uncharacterized protein n=2 Tax=Ancylostoma duodenale TaxID=51022 RepID=A0A0C2H863_9BILA|nr:hypothetical protein ANCDUO_03996 [Ancylostoma duodenale]
MQCDVYDRVQTSESSPAARAMSRLTLWVRAGSDGLRCGGDPAAHQLFMLMLWKAELDPNLKFDVKTVNESRPPPEFREV